METIADKRIRHADWALEMAESYRAEAAKSMSEYWRAKFLKDAENMEAEAAWSEQSAEYMQ